jgi:hypothetical protein
LKLLEEMRAVQAYLATLPDGETPFVASLSSAWHVGEIRPTFSIDSKPRYLRGLEKVSAQALIPSPTATSQPTTPPVPTPTSANTREEKPQPIYAKPGHARVQALRMVWPIVCRRLEGLPNINAMQLFDELCIQLLSTSSVR